MPSLTRPSGIQITVPSTYRVGSPPKSSMGQRRGPITRPTGPVPLPSQPAGGSAENDAIVQALTKQELDHLDTVVVEPEPSSKRVAAPADEGKDLAEISFEVAPNESGVVLLEQDGFYSWVLPAAAESVVSSKESAGVQRGSPRKKVVFRVNMPSSQGGAKPPTRRGFVKDFVFGRIRAFVFKFAAHIMVDHGMRFLERNVHKGMMRISSLDPTQWSAINDTSVLNFPQDRPARVLLFVHGTFSNTVGAFGALGGTPWGKAWLEAALTTYDAIIGFDHPTLSENPLENATDLLNALQAIKWSHPPHFDVVVHSRGALVFRSLVENLLPSSRWQAHFDRAVFVAGTNGGTLLAEPRNWMQLIDLYTNLTAAACRLLGLMPHAQAVTLVLREGIQGIGAFLKYCATTAITEGRVPGIAAMEPDGQFVKDLNRAQPGQPTVASSFYCAITSTFVPQLVSGEPRPKELPTRLITWILEVLAKEVMEEPNDLVVNTAAMTAIDLEVGNFIKDKLDFGENPEVYHTNYFTRPEVTNALAKWLNLQKTTTPEKKVRTRRIPVKTATGKFKFRSAGGGKLRTAEKQKRSATRATVHQRISFSPSGTLLYDVGTTAEPLYTAALDTDFIVNHASTPISKVIANIKKDTPSYVVLRRPHQGKTLDYAFASEEILLHPNAASSEPAMDVLDLHETDSSASIPIFEPIKRPQPRKSPTSGRAVVLAGDRPIGVLPESTYLTKHIDLAKLAKAAGSSKIEDRILARRAMPTIPSTPDATIPMSKAPTVTCHFHAEMDEEVLLGHVTTIEVLVSREAIGRLLNVAAKSGVAEVEAERKLIIQVIPKANFETVDGNRVEILPPPPGQPQTLLFDVRPTHAGQGELWVVVRQAQIPLVTLVLQPNIAASKTSNRRKVSSSADTAEAGKLPGPLHQLSIIEQRNGDQISYLYQLQSPDLKLLEWTNSKPFTGDRHTYVENLYKEIEQRWLSNKSDVDAFTAELRAFGGQLLEELMPEHLRTTLWNHRNELKSIMVISTEPFIPWELVHLKDPAKGMTQETRFLGQMGLVRWLHQAGWPPEFVLIREGKVRYVVPDYPHPDYVLPEASKERDFLKQAFQAKAVTPQPNEVREILQEAGAFDLLHFACHGFAESDNISNAQLMLEGKIENQKYVPAYLSATTADQFSNLKTEENRPMVILNACQAARAGYTLTGVGGFAQAFINRGAGCFVSSLWSVGDSPARTFTETLYSRLLQSKKLSDAAIDAREKAKATGDATWLAYAVYGHPYMRVKRK